MLLSARQFQTVGRLCQTPASFDRRFTRLRRDYGGQAERSGGDAGDTDGQTTGRMSGRE
jgi:hypothetical protein